MGLLILIFVILWGWAEVTAFIIIGGEIGGLLTFIGVFLTAVVGLWLLRGQAANVMANLRQQVTRGEAPLAAVAESLSLLIGGILMLIPGYVTDGLGLLLFVPGLRTVVGLAIMSRLLRAHGFAALREPVVPAFTLGLPAHNGPVNKEMMTPSLKVRQRKKQKTPTACPGQGSHQARHRRRGSLCACRKSSIHAMSLALRFWCPKEAVK